MHRATWMVIALALASPAYSQSQESGSQATSKSEKKAAPKKKAKQGAPATTGAASTGKSKAAPAAKDDPDAPARASMLRARRIFIYSAESCQQEERCDRGLRDDAEQRFMDACQACGTAENCEADRAAIRDGTAKRSGNPCAK